MEKVENPSNPKCNTINTVERYCFKDYLEVCIASGIIIPNNNQVGNGVSISSKIFQLTSRIHFYEGQMMMLPFRFLHDTFDAAQFDYYSVDIKRDVLVCHHYAV
jgi:hypothetical protein